ncbi:MAG: tail fiber domain-containing protein, partial [Planctomycetes bacterium]|nr:tail fiber domain-containing protein [Planctomycetota bacterium]
NLPLVCTSVDASRIYFEEGADHRCAVEGKGTSSALVLNDYHPSLGIVDVMYWDYTHGIVGIGTTTPSEQLDVNGHVNSSQSYKLDGETVLSNPGTGNFFIGQRAGDSNATGIYNSAIGNQALGGNTTGYYNVGVGHQANSLNQEGSNNTIIGFQAGRGNTSHNKSGNVFIGYQAGYNETDSNKLYIDNSDTAAPLIYGDFASNTLAINGELGIGTMSPANKLSVIGTANFTGNVGIGTSSPSDKLQVENYSGNTSAKIRAQSGGQSSLKLFEGGDYGFEFQYDGDPDKLYLLSRNFTGNEAVRMTWQKDGNVGIGSSTPERKLYVNGDAGGAEAWHNDSDARLKKNITTIENALQKVQNLRGVKFEWSETQNHPQGKQIGFIGQETEKVVPEVVDVIDGTYSMQYAPLTALLVEAVKQQQKQIESMKEEIETLKDQLKTENR